MCSKHEMTLCKFCLGGIRAPIPFLSEDKARCPEGYYIIWTFSPNWSKKYNKKEQPHQRLLLRRLNMSIKPIETRMIQAIPTSATPETQTSA